jgi:hypothetical protein
MIRRLQRSNYSCVLYGLVMLFLTCLPLQAMADDNDGDGIDDDLEMQLAARFLPTRHFSINENCIGPVPRPVLFRVRPMSVGGVVHTDYIGIHYVELYDDDCGSLGHSGDNESSFLIVTWDGNDWVFRGLAATAHWGTSCERRGSNANNNIWVSEGKHANYTSPPDCWGDCFNANHCQDPGYTIGADLYNVGEPDNHGWPFVNNLGEIRGAWDGYTAWGGGNFKDAGVIRDQLFFTRYDDPYGSPENYNCRVACNADYYQCYDTCNGDIECQANCSYTAQGCFYFCDSSYRWDP